jgi:MFS family permease
MSEPHGCQPSRFEGLYAGIGGALFSFAMGLSAVAIPLLALDQGFTAGQVGVFVAGSACAQLGIRSVMGALMRRIPDRHFVTLAGVLMATSCLVLLVSTEWWVFAISQVAQGSARGFFWTGSQTHVVRTSPSAVAAIAKINLTSGIGQIAGPFAAGPLIEHSSITTSLGVAGAVAVGVLVPSCLMVRLEPLRPAKRNRGAAMAVWRQPDLGLASWAGATAGAWRSMMNSFVPVVLQQAAYGPQAIGIVTGIANATSIGGGAGAGLIKGHRLRATLIGGIAFTGVGLAAFGWLAGHPVMATVALAASGIGAGLLQTMGPALATESVSADERGEAIATAGTYRAAALLCAPLCVSALVVALAAPAAVAVLGVALAGPVVIMRKQRRVLG